MVFDWGIYCVGSEPRVGGNWCILGETREDAEKIYQREIAAGNILRPKYRVIVRRKMKAA